MSILAIVRLDPLIPSKSMYYGITAERAVQLAIDHINGGDPILAIEMSRMPQLSNYRLNVVFYDFIVGIAVEITNGIPALSESLDEFPPITLVGFQGTDLVLTIETLQG